MLLPRIQTHPTEIEFAFWAFHMVASFVLLDRWLTIRARFTIGHEPIAVGCIFTLSTRRFQFFRSHFSYLLKPLKPLFTTYVWFFNVFFFLSTAFNIGYWLEQLVFNGQMGIFFFFFYLRVHEHHRDIPNKRNVHFHSRLNGKCVVEL